MSLVVSFVATQLQNIYVIFFRIRVTLESTTTHDSVQVTHLTYVTISVTQL